MDTVVGKRERKARLLVLIESKKQIIEKLKSKDNESVIEGFKRIFERYPKSYKNRF